MNCLVSRVCAASLMEACIAAVPVGPIPAVQPKLDLLPDIQTVLWVLHETHKLTLMQVQTIGFLSHLREKNIYGPFMVVGPLSTLSNWVDEFKRWLPSMNVILYHGSKDERQKLRTKHMPHGMICTSAASMHDTTTHLIVQLTRSGIKNDFCSRCCIQLSHAF